MIFILKRLGIDPKEFSKLFLLILHSFFSAIFVSIFFSVANAEFVSNFGSDFLPVGYLLSGIVGYIMVQGYSRLLKKSGYSAFVGGLLFLLGCTILFRACLYFAFNDSAKWLSFVIFLFAMPFLSLSGLEQSGLLLKIYDIREGKKYAGIINAGGTVASIVGYLSVPLLIPFLGSRFDLFYVAIFGMSAAIYILIKINKKLNLADQKAAILSGAVKTDISLGSLLRQKYILYIAICGGISMMAFYFVDYSFLINAKSQARSPEQLSAIIGGFFGFIKTVELILSLLSGRIFRRFGLKMGIVILPSIIVFITLCAILSYHFFNPGAFIVIVFALKFFERMVSKAIEEPTYKNLYQLLNINDRLAIQAKIDGGTKQLFIIFGSIILILYGSLMSPHLLKIGLLYISLPVFLFWLFSAGRLVSAFKERLRDILASGHEQGEDPDLSPFDRLRSTLDLFQKTGEVKNSVATLLTYKLDLSTKVTSEENRDEASRLEKYVPAPFLNYLVPTPGCSRININLYEPLLIIPPKGPSIITETRSYETLDEKEILRIALSGNEPDEEIIKALGKKLDDAKSDHEKKLILNILRNSKTELSTNILVNRLDYPDYYTRKQVFKTLENKNYKYDLKDEIHFRNSLETTLSDITYIISILAALPAAIEYEDLINALTEEENILKNRLLSILTWKYDKASIMVIRENIFSDRSRANNSNNILALELIDNLIDSELKPQIMPVFENDTYGWRLSALNKWFYFPSLNLKDALISLLHYDYTKIGIWTKACALGIVMRDENNSFKNIISGFNYHPNTLLRLLAREYYEAQTGNAIYSGQMQEGTILNNYAKKESGNLTGAQQCICIKQLKNNIFFRKASYNDLAKFSNSIELKNRTNLHELAGIGNPKNKPFFISEGDVIFEYRKIFPLEAFSKNLINHSVFGGSRLSKILTHSNTTQYEFSANNLMNLVITSDSMINDLIKNDL